MRTEWYSHCLRCATPLVRVAEAERGLCVLCEWVKS